MAIDKFVPGYRFDPARYQEYVAERVARGDKVFGSQQDGLAGTWAKLKAEGVTCIILREAEKILLGGKHRRGALQRRGTCVARAFYRALQTALDFAIVRRGELLLPVEVTFAPIYSLARNEIGKGRVGYGDGAMVCDAAQACHDFGVATSALFPGLTEDQIESLACQYADPRQRTPEAWKAACFGNTCDTYSPDNLSLLFDCIATGHPAAFGNNWLTGMPNKNGLSRLEDNGAHARCFTGCYVDDKGVDRLICDESWGRYPAGQPMDIDQTIDVEKIPCITIMTANGPVKLPPSSVGVDAGQYWNACKQTGEVWAVSAPRFLGDSIADMTNKTQNA